MAIFNGPIAKVISGALVKIYINGQVYPVAQQVSFTIDTGATEIYGIDSPYPQEITPTRATVKGTVAGLRVKESGGIQGYSGMFRKEDILSTSYISLRIQDRSTAEDILFIPNAMIGSQTFNVATRGTASVTFSFSGLVGLEPLDRVDKGIKKVDFGFGGGF